MNKNFLFAAGFICLLSFSNCTSPEEKKITEEEKHYMDSVSKARQKLKVDSLKQKNPLLIMPPDSDYTGAYVDKYPSGITKFRGSFRFGKRHGQWMSFFPNGLLWSEMQYDKGLREGANIAYFENGKIRYSGFYKQDVKDSIWCYYDSLGKLSEKVLFKNDRFIKEIPF
jgi:antitoxin component YwqK of YwqJK toxin-antitoxin module